MEVSPMKKESGFYGGKIGVWLPVLFMLEIGRAHV